MKRVFRAALVGAVIGGVLNQASVNRDQPDRPGLLSDAALGSGLFGGVALVQLPFRRWRGKR